MGVRSVFVLIVILAASVLAAQAQADDLMAQIRESHINANVPDKKDFDAILKRDLTKYVIDPGERGISVSAELLRDAPTQSGVAFPKFYCWITKTNSKGVVIEEAAARIAAVAKTHFDVIQYFERKRILAEPDLMVNTFPRDVYEKILKKVKTNE